MTLISDKEKTEVWQGVEDVANKALEVLYKVQNTLDLCTDVNGPSVILTNEIIAEAYVNLHKRRVKVRFITEITHDNIRYCKEMMKIAELRHLDGTKGSFAIADGTDYSGVANTQEAQPITQLIVSNVKAFVDQQKYFFETLWSKSTPAEQRIREIEEGIVRNETRVLGRPEEILAEMTGMNERSSELCICSAPGGLQFARNFLFDVTKRVLEKHRKGQHSGIKYVTSITDENAALVREFLDLGMQLRHVKNMPPMSFGVSEKEMGATIEKMEEGSMVRSLLVSNESFYVQHFRSIFEELWNSGIDANERIKEMEQGVEAADIEIMRSPQEALERAWNIIKSSQEEVQLMFSTRGAFKRQLQMGGLEVLKQALKSGAAIKILLPADEQIKIIAAQLAAQLPNVEIRMMDKSLQTKITILVVDRKQCMLFELKDDTKQSSYEAVGLSMHSSSKTIVLSYASIFDSLWKQTELYDQLASAKEQLEVHDKMQQEFINIAAHELRTPIQPILGMAEMLEAELGGRNEEIRMIVRNARRLEELTRNILDVSKIESQSLKLDMNEFNFNDVVLNAIEDYSDQLARSKVRLLYQPVDIFVRADRGRITQVISNLLSNASKFTEDGTVTVAAHKNSHNIVFSVSDTGTGIDREIFPRLFTKFATKSTRGTGLGLFISKSIIEAHGGRIWAENNKDGRGATLSFSIPALQ